MAHTGANGAPRWLWGGLIAAAIVLLAAEVFVHHHAAFGVDGTFAFYGWYTVVVGVIGVACARLLALLLGRRGGDDDV